MQILQSIVDFVSQNAAIIGTVLSFGVIEVLSRIWPSTKVVSVFRQAIRIIKLPIGVLLLVSKLLESTAQILDRVVPDQIPEPVDLTPPSEPKSQP